MSEQSFWQSCPVPLRWALGVSIGFHLLVIFPLVVVLHTPIAMPQAPLSAILKGPGDAVQAAPEHARQLTPLAAGEALKTKSHDLKKPVPTQDKSATAHPEKATTPTVAGVAQGDAAQANTASRSGTVGGAPDSARDGVEADALNRYRMALGVEARKARRYPEASRTRGQEGTCEIFVVLSRNGGQPVVLPGKSSGSTVLDEGALVMVRIAAERTLVPQELQGRNLKIPLRIRFSLDDF